MPITCISRPVPQAGRALDLRTLDCWLRNGVFGVNDVAPALAAELRCDFAATVFPPTGDLGCRGIRGGES